MCAVGSVRSDALRLHGLQPARILCPCDFSDKNTGMGSHFLLQGIFWTQGSNLCLLHRQAVSLPLYHCIAIFIYTEPKPAPGNRHSTNICLSNWWMNEAIGGKDITTEWHLRPFCWSSGSIVSIHCILQILNILLFLLQKSQECQCLKTWWKHNYVYGIPLIYTSNTLSSKGDQICLENLFLITICLPKGSKITC